MKTVAIVLSLLILAACNDHQMGGFSRGLNAGVATTGPGVYNPNLWPAYRPQPAIHTYSFQGRNMTCFQGQFGTNCY